VISLKICFIYYWKAMNGARDDLAPGGLHLPRALFLFFTVSMVADVQK
jgi:hypothetical protein